MSSRAKRRCRVSSAALLLTVIHSPTRSQFQPQSCSKAQTLLAKTLSAELILELNSDSFCSVDLYEEIKFHVGAEQ